MNPVTSGLLSVLMGYLLGSVPFGYLIVRWKKGIDVRGTGSGSIGATNVMRNLGVSGFLATLVLDTAKGAGSVLLARQWTAHAPAWVSAAAFAVVLGHCFPAWLKFRGGKGVATGLGAFACLSPLPLGVALAVFAAAVAIWRYVSLGSVLAAAAFPAALYFLNHPPRSMVFGAVGAAGIIIVRHQANLGRLLKGTEHRLGQPGGSRAADLR